MSIKFASNNTVLPQASFSQNEDKEYNKPKGHLIEHQPITHHITDTYNTTKDFYKALKGEGTDYTLGRLNDIATMAGSLGIAATLAKANPSKSSKAMEFVGFGTWFASMALWPKLFIGMPVKAKTGVDINQQYVDSYGRKKRFLEDAQYIPWDLVSDKKMNHIADKMNLPKTMKNRREATEDKIRQVSVQANTLWMLTAGLSTPLMSSLLADTLQPYVKAGVEKHNINKAQQALENAFDSKKEIKIDPKLEKNIKSGNVAEIKDYFANVGQKLNDKYAPKLNDKAAVKYKNFVDSELTSILGNSKDSLNLGQQNALKTLYKDTDKADKLLGYFKATLGDCEGSGLANEWGKVPQKMLNTLQFNKKDIKELSSANSEDAAKLVTKKLSSLKDDTHVVNKLADIIQNPLENTVKAQKTIEKYSKMLTGGMFNQKSTVGYGEQKSFQDLLNTNVVERLDDANSTFRRMTRFQEVAKSTPNDLKTFVKGVSDNSFHELNLLSKQGQNPKRYEELIKLHFGHLSDDHQNFIKNALRNQKSKGAYELSEGLNPKDVYKIQKQFLGQQPLGFLQDAAKQKQVYKNWKGAVGALSAATLLFTAITIAMMGKTNKYNPDVKSEGGTNTNEQH